jgi:hypothetical protein
VLSDEDLELAQREGEKKESQGLRSDSADTCNKREEAAQPQVAPSRFIWRSL